MGVFFGTDGIRGVVGEELTYHLASACGNALTRIKPNCKIIIARDPRLSGQSLAITFGLGAMLGGAHIIDIGIASTPAISYLTKQLHCDFGVVISASHNPAEYNGIKIFDSTGKKLGDKAEQELERKLITNNSIDYNNIGKIEFKPSILNIYTNYLLSLCENYKGMSIVIDCANGASRNIAQKIFKSAGAKVYCTGISLDGSKINKNCGATHPEHLAKIIKKYNADIGFSFDGDADRIIVCDSQGHIYSGDHILYCLAKYYKANNLLQANAVVGTSMTNFGLELSLKQLGIGLERADVGDKFVIDKMCKLNCNLGGEQSGHIIMSNYLPTGDGVLAAIILTNILKNSAKNTSSMFGIKLFPQVIVNVSVKDKLRVMGSEILANVISYANQELLGNGRVLVRPSGTEQKIRIMTEANSYRQAKLIADYIAAQIENIKEETLCAE